MEGSKGKLSRRKFIGAIGTSAAGLFAAPYIKSASILEYNHKKNPEYVSKVAVAKADNYERSFVKNKVQHLFNAIDGISDIVKPGNKVAIKVNLVGGSPSVNMWTHPEVLRAVSELIIDTGVKAQDIFLVEATWNDTSLNALGYPEVIQSLGIQKINLNKAAPYSEFINRSTGDKKFFYNSFTLNQILSEVDVFVSIGKLKQHYEAGFTGSIKNLVGIVPMSYYTLPYDSGRRGALHQEGGPSSTHLPKSICDLFLARPIHLSVIDGIVNARGGEGTWNPTFKPAADHVLFAGKDPVATDSVAAHFLGCNPEKPKFVRPDRSLCDNHLYMLNQKGLGTNKIKEIEIVGDGADLITSVRSEQNVDLPKEIKLLQNFPNPFNPATRISFYLPSRESVTLKIYDTIGKLIEVLLDGSVPAGHHEFHWAPKNLASGVYYCHLLAGDYALSNKMIYQK